MMSRGSDATTSGIRRPLVRFDDPLILPCDLHPMLSDYPNAAKLTLADRLRLMADGLPEDSLDYGTLQVAADILEDLGYGPQSIAGPRIHPSGPTSR